MKFIFLFCFLLLFINGKSQSFFSDSSSLSYARFLYDNNEYDLVEEVLNPHLGKSKNDSLYVLYLKSAYSQKHYYACLHMSMPEGVPLEQSNCFLQALRIKLDSFDQLNNLILIDPLLKAYLFLKEGDTIAVQELIQTKQLEDSIYLKDQISILAKVNPKRNFPIYSSVILPGSGKYVLGMKKDALLSFFSFATYTFLAVRAFDRYGIGSTFAWVNTALAAAFYGANIYGTHAEIKRQIKFREQLVKKSVNEKLDNYMFALPH